MTYLYYKTSTYTSNQKPNETTINQWNHLAQKKNWRITQLPNGFYQTECLNPDNMTEWHDVTRRETVEGAETAINGSVEFIVNEHKRTKSFRIITKTKTKTMGTPYKMKGSPMQRNFGISPVRQTEGVKEHLN
jgi:hypothetical protein